MVSKFVLPWFLGMVSLFCVPSVKTTVNNVNALDESNKTVLKKEIVHDYSAEVEIPDGNLVVSATASSLTEMGQSFSFMFTTGGQGWCDSTTTFLLAPDDPDFDKYIEEVFSPLTVDQREKIAEDYEKGEYTPREFNSYVYSLDGTNSVHDIYIPRLLTRNHIFNLNVTSLGVDLVSDWSKISSITIPKEIESIYLDSFQNVPDTMVFNVELASDPEGWAPGWNRGATVNYGVAFPEEKAEPLSRAGAKMYGDVKQNFIIGWYPKEGEQKPLVLEYKLHGQDEKQYFVFSPSSESSIFECVGKEINDYTKPLYCDVPLNPGESIDFDSVVLHNIYRTKTNDAGVAITEPDFSQAYNIVPKQGFLRVYSITDFIKCEFNGLSSFAGYTALDLNIKLSEANVYEHLKPNYYNAHEKDLKDGKLRVRYRLTSLTLCYFRTTFVSSLKESVKYTIKADDPLEIMTDAGEYKRIKELSAGDKIMLDNGGIVSLTYIAPNIEKDNKGNDIIVSYSFIVSNSGVYKMRKDIKIETPITQVKLENANGNKVSFLLKNSNVFENFSAENLRSVSFVGLYVTLDLMTAKAIIARSNVITRFGYYQIMPFAENSTVFNINALLVIVAASYVVAFIALTVALYFYLKNKYKNDEFKRMKNKPYIIKSVLFLFGSMVVLFDVIFIVLRAVAFNNAIVVYNPVDAFIIVLSVLSVIIIGYFIKYLVGVIKTNKERRRILKLKLNEDVEDDGTN